MLKIDIDDPIESYSESVIAGMDARTTIVACIAVAAGIGWFFLIFFVLGMSVEVFVFTYSIVCIFVCILAQKNEDGMSYLQRKKKRKQQRPVLEYQSTESVIRAECYRAGKEVSGAEATDDTYEETVRFLKRMVFIGVLMAAVITVLVFVIHQNGGI
ncbi:MAG: hypothetical protein LUH14_03960 [Clostridiaceae bacterium]|nr:hypothetical protein [Clostridiaceae bacterium]